MCCIGLTLALRLVAQEHCVDMAVGRWQCCAFKVGRGNNAMLSSLYFWFVCLEKYNIFVFGFALVSM